MTRKDATKKKFQDINDKTSIFQVKIFLGIAIVLVLSVICNTICFFHSTRSDSHLFAEKLSNSQLIASFDFSYESELMTKSRQNLVADIVLPSYKINEPNFLTTNKNKDAFALELQAIDLLYTALSEEDREKTEHYEDFAKTLRAKSNLTINPYDLKILLRNKDKTSFDRFFELTFPPFKTILLDGIYADSDKTWANAALSNLNLKQDDTGISQAKSENQARQELRFAINALGLENGLSGVAFRLFSPMLRPNLEYDEVTTKTKKQEAISKVSPVIVYVREGEILVEPSMELTPFVREKLNAYRKERIEKSSTDYSLFGTLNDFTISIFLISAATLFIVVSKNPRTKKKQTVISMIVLFLLNLLALRVVIDMLDKTDADSGVPLLLIFSYALPVLLGPLSQVLIVGAYTGFIMSLLLSSFTTLMLGESIEYFVIVFVASLVAIYYCEFAKTRSRILTGGFFCGLTLAFGCILTGIVSQAPVNILLTQSIFAISSALLCAVIAMLFLPLTERVFNACSNITLFELTSFNRPLLYKLQMTAPGTFHHSIMVAQLAEQAATSIKANDLLCRVGALYHDIGKLSKPEFFIENQRGLGNPHDNQSPSMSALIIKNHVKEGIEIAKLSKLPDVIIDMIKQHHGTTLVGFFYSKAKKMAQEAHDNGDEIRVDVQESTYRYEEIKPETAESTILMLADACEAASRSLKKITHQSIDELVKKIIDGKMADGQLDNAPITIRQLNTIKASLSFTILNMNHTRVEYPDDKKTSKK